MRRIASTARPATSRIRLRISTGSSPKAAEGRTIPTCRFELRGILAAALLLPSAATAARIEEPSALAAYVEARAAGSAGALERSVAAYRVALAASPYDELLASRALGQAILAGDRPLAVAAARALEAAGAGAPDIRLLLLTEALRSSDWKAASAQIDRIARDEVFAFAAPVLRAWLAVDTRKGDPLAHLPPAGADGLAAAYADDHRPLLLASGKRKQGAALLLARAGEQSGARTQRLRLAGAAALAGKGDREGALSLLQGSAPALAAARRLVIERRPLPGAVTNAQAGAGEFMLQLALDIHSQQMPELALTMSRLATFVAPGNSAAWLVTSELLAAQDMPELALAVLAEVHPDDPFASGARDARIRLLGDAAPHRALEEALAAAGEQGAAVGDWVRLGELYLRLDQPGQAGEAFGKALAVGGEGDANHPEWLLWLMRGDALVRADDWSQGKAALERAHALAPDQPQVLNHLGYSQLERRENVEAAAELIARASLLAPDNPAIADSLGWAHFLRGDVASAIVALERAVEGDPASAAINEHLGDAYYSAGRRTEARFAWRAALLEAGEQAAERLREKIDTGLNERLVSP